MLLIDGVKYELWIPSTEDEFEEIIKEHAKDIFGEDSIYFDLKKKLKTRAGIGSIPDGYVISLQEESCWYICEVEFHTHQLYEHIIAQLQKIITAAKTLQSQGVVRDAIYSEIKSAPFKEALIKSKIGTEDLHHFISNLISKPPILVIPIDQKIDGLEEACDGLPIEEVRIVEFKTFVREGVDLAVHAHLFEPLYQVITPKVTIVSERGKVTPAPTPPGEGVKIKDLVDAGIIKVGQVIYRLYKGQRFEGKVLNDGSIELAHTGEKFGSLSGAAKDIAGSVDGWTWWHTKRQNGIECLLDALREEYRATRPSKPYN